EMTTSVKNLSDAPHPYALTVNTASYLLDSEVESRMFRQNPMMTHVECVSEAGEVVREKKEDFRPGEFSDEERFISGSMNPGDWSQPAGTASVIAVSNAYFTNAISHDAGPSGPACQLQVEDRGTGDDAAALYKARFAYEERNLAAGKSETYAFHTFIGPKERKALSAAGPRFEPLIDLGFFSPVANILVKYLLFVYSLVKSWGVAIVLLTITARMLLFPLTWPSVKNMVQMRELKPEMDKLNAKYKDDPQAKGLAQMELWKKHKVNPMKGCLPQLVSMPVWFALYTTLQTAVELYHIPFLWFPDLSEPDPLYILPIIIGGVFFLQQKLMPMQADPAQQKMMMYFMPSMFTLFMLFLPAGLGVYMFTNSLLGIAQQRVVERHAKSTLTARKAQALQNEERSAIKKKKKNRS
ncbi:MAG: YidC/Oxa1 family insertase periplasmic-domain containing protein, partial [Polyangiaceae bacterium]|nr:YidC/Oxa1 family insertase periplasmic-domain containing protein [Polyangiaceae bacterium]